MNNTPYVPVKEDFQFLPERDITTDQNFASQGYWKGVAVSFFKNRRAVVGLVIVVLIMFFAAFGPIMNSYGYADIVSVTTEEGKKIVAQGISPQIPGLISGGGNTELFGDYTFLFGTDDMGRDLWTRTWQGARISLIIAFVTIVIDMIIGMSALWRSPTRFPGWSSYPCWPSSCQRAWVWLLWPCCSPSGSA